MNGQAAPGGLSDLTAQHRAWGQKPAASSLVTFPRGCRGEAQPSWRGLWGVEEGSLEEAVLLKGFTFISGSKDLLTK